MMTKPLEIDPLLVENSLQENDYSSLADYLNHTFKLERNTSGVPIQYKFSEKAISVLYKILRQILKEECQVQNLTKELFKALRNYVITRDVQNYFIQDSDFLNNVKQLLVNLQSNGNDIRQIILQFLINLIILNETGASKIFMIFFDQIFLFLKERKCIYETSALLYNISLYKSIEDINFDLYKCILELYEENSAIEFLYFLVEKFLSYDKFLSHYKNFNLKHRIIILEVLKHGYSRDNNINLSIGGLEALVDYFINSGDIIFQTIRSNESNLEPFEISQLLQILSSLCSNESYLKIFQKDKNLLINTGVLLINIHRLGKESENCFSSIQRLAEIREPTESIREHPAFGFKADLIRIIGNLCWKNKTMQDLVREAELIPVILDCCNMDARNPFIMQWVILAVRNLCENNLKNQEIIAGLHQQGTVSSSTLEEMGLTLHSDGANSIKIIPLNNIQK